MKSEDFYNQDQINNKKQSVTTASTYCNKSYVRKKNFLKKDIALDTK